MPAYQRVAHREYQYAEGVAALACGTDAVVAASRTELEVAAVHRVALRRICEVGLYCRDVTVVVQLYVGDDIKVVRHLSHRY